MQQPTNFIPQIAPYPALPDGRPGALPPLEPNALASFPLHPFAQRSLYLYSMVNFAPLVEPILEVMNPRHVAEVGSERGNNTLFLYRWVKAHNARLTLVDTHPNVDPEMASDPAVSVYKGMSVDFLKTNQDLDLVYLDGDHNYETVTLELQGLERQQQATGKPLVVLLHDVAWPCDRRDMYYDPDTVSDKRPFTHEGGVEPFHTNLTPMGPGGSGRFAIASTSGGPANGVLTAVEDFLASRKDSGWRFHLTPVVHGLGILWWDPALTDAQRAVFRDVTSHLTRMTPFLAALELNRLALGIAVNAAGVEWQKNVNYIKELETRLTTSEADLSAQVRTLVAQLERDTDGYKGYIQKLEAELAANAAAHQREQDYIRQLQSQLDAALKDARAYSLSLEQRLDQQAAAVSDAQHYIKDLESRLAQTGGAHENAITYIRTLEASLTQHTQLLGQARADHAAAQAFADQQSRALEGAVAYIRTLESRQTQLTAELESAHGTLRDAQAQLHDAQSQLRDVQAQHASEKSAHDATRAELQRTSADLARLLALPATSLFWRRVRGTLPNSTSERQP